MYAAPGACAEAGPHLRCAISARCTQAPSAAAIDTVSITRVPPEHLARAATLDALAALRGLRALALPRCSLRTLQQLGPLSPLTALSSLDVRDNALEHLSLLPTFVRQALTGVRVLNGSPLLRPHSHPAGGSEPGDAAAMHTWAAVAAHAARARATTIAQILWEGARCPSAGGHSLAGAASARGGGRIVATGAKGGSGACGGVRGSTGVAQVAEGLLIGAIAAAARLEELDECWDGVVRGVLDGGGGCGDLDGL